MKQKKKKKKKERTVPYTRGNNKSWKTAQQIQKKTNFLVIKKREISQYVRND